MAVVVPYNASFVDEGHPRISVTSDVVVEALFIVGKHFLIVFLVTSILKFLGCFYCEEKDTKEHKYRFSL